MKENEFINVIKNTVNNNYIGDDCAYLKDLGIVVTQDSLLEGIHFKKEWYTPYELGYKSIAVNISDILASGAKPAYITVSLSIPNDITKTWVKEFYEGAKSVLYSAEIVGGDITGSNDGIFISVCAIGKTENRTISSRSNAKEGYSVVIATKDLGKSSAGLKELINNGNNADLINSHILPKLNYEFSKYISENIKTEYAMMDTSDGLADALFKIAEHSGVKINIDYDLIPRSEYVNKEQLLFGGEDYKLVAVIPEDFANRMKNIYKIGYVEKYDGIRLNISGKKYKEYDELDVYDHFGENND